jgi:hypothetical protein
MANQLKDFHMIDLKKLRKNVAHYNRKNKLPVTDYSANRERLLVLVERYSVQVVSIATGLSESTIKQHIRNKAGTGMISTYRLDKAEAVLEDM